MLFAIELIVGLVLFGLVVAVVGPVVFLNQVRGGPGDRLSQAKTEREIARFKAETAEFRLEADKREAQRTIMNMKTSAEMEDLQDRLYQKQLEPPKKVKGEVVEARDMSRGGQAKRA